MQDTRAMLSDFKFYEGYSRWDDGLGRYEKWDESVDRVMTMHRDFYASKLTPELEVLINEATTAYKHKQVLGAQRSLQFGGKQIVEHQMRMFNCTSSYADRPEFFGEYYYILLCGAGVGFSVQKQHVKMLPKVKVRNKQPKTHVVDDSIEGWATALDVLLSSYFVGGGKHPEYEGRRVYFDLTQIRPKGAPVSGGFKAPGPDPLRKCLDRVEHLLQGIVLKNDEVKLAPIQVYDICMYVADSVLAGGIRRSATICLFSADDFDMVHAKSGDWLDTNPQRGRSNNSAVIKRDEICFEHFEAMMGDIKSFGEPGFFFVDDYDNLTNPCVEVGMYPKLGKKSGWQGCNLTEINGGGCKTEEQFYQACRAGAILGTLQAGYTNFKFLDDTSKKIFDREALLGVSITGWMSNPKLLFDERVLKKGAKIVKDVNKQVAKMIGINPAARTTCVKPSGNASVLLKTASGIHPEHSPYYIRNIQVNKQSDIAKVIKEINPHMVEESVWSTSGDDYVISFPIVAPKGSMYKDEMTGVKHLEKVRIAQQAWVNGGKDADLCVNKTVTHNVSNTIVVKDEEWSEVASYLYQHRAFFAGVAFISASGDKIYNQAPNTKVIFADEIVQTYGAGSIFASGLVVDALKVFPNLWNACYKGINPDAEIMESDYDAANQKDWIRRFVKFADSYFDGKLQLAEYCLKDVYLFHKWQKIQHNLKMINWDDKLAKQDDIDVNTLGAAACVGVNTDGCTI